MCYQDLVITYHDRIEQKNWQLVVYLLRVF